MSNELQFLEDSKNEIESNFSDVHCSFCSGRRIICFSMEFGHLPTENQVRKILEVIEGNVAKIKKTSVDRLVCVLYDRHESSPEIYG